MKGMKKYYTQKIMWYLLTLVFAVLLNFILPRFDAGSIRFQLLASKIGRRYDRCDCNSESI